MAAHAYTVAMYTVFVYKVVMYEVGVYKSSNARRSHVQSKEQIFYREEEEDEVSCVRIVFDWLCSYLTDVHQACRVSALQLLCTR